MFYKTVAVICMLSAFFMYTGNSDNLIPNRRNLALGASYTFSIKPSYSYKGDPMCTDEGDLTQLTDGEVSEQLWFDKRAVGIGAGKQKTVDITIDLGKSQPIETVAVNVMARYQAGVAFPLEIRVFTSDNNKDLFFAGRLKTWEVMTPDDWKKRYQTFVIDNITAKGRYVIVSLVPTGGGKWTFLDEIQIYSPRNKDAEINPKGVWTTNTVLLPLYRDTVAYVSPDMPIPFQIMLPKGGTPDDLEITCPKGVKLADSPAYTKQVKTSDASSTTYEIKGSRTHHSWMTHIFLTTDVKEGDIGHLILKHKEISQKVLLKAIRIRQNPFPKKIITSSGWNSQKFYKNWPGFKKNWKRMGLNTVTIGWHDILKAKEEIRFKKLKKLISEFKDSGFYVAANSSPGSAWWANHVRKKQPELRQYVDRNGKAHNCVCPQIYMKLKFNDDLSGIIRAVKLGMSFYWLDYEPAWHGPCFCDDCQESLAKFQKKLFPELPVINQFELVKKPNLYPKQFKIFETYQIDFGKKMFGSLYEKTEKEVIDLKVSSSPNFEFGYYAVGPGGGKIRPAYFQFDNFYWTGIADFSMPDLYTTPTFYISKKLRRLRYCLKGPDLLPWLSTGAGFQDLERPAIHTKYMIFETLSSGAKGFTFFTVHGFDGLDWKYLADALAAVIPLEDIIVDGKLLDDEYISCKNAEISAIKAPGGIMVYLTDYMIKSPRTIRIEAQIDFDGEITDTETGEKLAEFKKGKRFFEIPMSPGKPVRMLYFGRKGEAEKRKINVSKPD